MGVVLQILNPPRHVFQRMLHPRQMSYLAFYDVASNRTGQLWLASAMTSDASDACKTRLS
jgi:hypothetical protein